MEKQEWTVEKKVNLGDLLTMFGMLVSLLAFVGGGWIYLHNKNIDQDRRITVTETVVSNMRREVDANQELMIKRFDRLEAMITRLDDKLDNKVDKK